MKSVRVKLGVHGDRGDAELTAGPDDPHRGSPPRVCRRDLVEHGSPSSRDPRSQWEAPRADGPAVPERSVEQATPGYGVEDRFHGRLWREGASSPLAVAESLQVVDSTNRYLVDLVRSGLPGGSQVPAGYAVVADHQSRGRGRLDRSWEAPAGTAVLCSILLRPELQPGQLHLAAGAVAVSAISSCHEVAGVELALKWPNDLICGDLKVAGVLSQVVGGRSSGSLGAVVVGIGINVNWPEGWPPEQSEDPELASISANATALNRISGRAIDRAELVGRLLAHTGAWNLVLGHEAGRQALMSRYRRACATVGREVRVELTDEIVVGNALDIDDDGSLLVSTDNCIRAISAGDVVHLR